MARNVQIQVLRGVEANLQSAMPLALGEMYFTTDSGKLFFGTPGTGLGYIQIGDTTNVNNTLQQIAVLLECIRRALVSIAVDSGRGAKQQDFDPDTVANDLEQISGIPS